MPPEIIAAIARTRADHETDFMPEGEVRRRIGMITGRDLMGRALADRPGGDADVKYCLDEGIDDGRATCVRFKFSLCRVSIAVSA